jgi:hypothetical protein
MSCMIPILCVGGGGRVAIHTENCLDNTDLQVTCAGGTHLYFTANYHYIHGGSGTIYIDDPYGPRMIIDNGGLPVLNRHYGVTVDAPAPSAGAPWPDVFAGTQVTFPVIVRNFGCLLPVGDTHLSTLIVESEGMIAAAGFALRGDALDMAGYVRGLNISLSFTNMTLSGALLWV